MISGTTPLVTDGLLLTPVGARLVILNHRRLRCPPRLRRDVCHTRFDPRSPVSTDKRTSFIRILRGVPDACLCGGDSADRSKGNWRLLRRRLQLPGQFCDLSTGFPQFIENTRRKRAEYFASEETLRPMLFQVRSHGPLFRSIRRADVGHFIGSIIASDFLYSLSLVLIRFSAPSSLHTPVYQNWVFTVPSFHYPLSIYPTGSGNISR